MLRKKDDVTVHLNFCPSTTRPAVPFTETSGDLVAIVPVSAIYNDQNLAGNSSQKYQKYFTRKFDENERFFSGKCTRVFWREKCTKTHLSLMVRFWQRKINIFFSVL
jgi:hypothetical protein